MSRNRRPTAGGICLALVALREARLGDDGATLHHWETSGSLTAAAFGRVTSARTTTGGPRVIQIGGKYIF
jgi:hypothetical protein